MVWLSKPERTLHVPGLVPDGRGFRPLIGEALSRGIAVLTAVNPGNLPGFLQFAGDYAEALPPDVDAIVDWCNAQRLAA